MLKHNMKHKSYFLAGSNVVTSLDIAHFCSFHICNTLGDFCKATSYLIAKKMQFLPKPAFSGRAAFQVGKGCANSIVWECFLACISISCPFKYGKVKKLQPLISHLVADDSSLSIR